MLYDFNYIVSLHLSHVCHSDLGLHITLLALPLLSAHENSLVNIFLQAYMYGFFKNKRIVLYDTLIQQVRSMQLLFLFVLVKRMPKSCFMAVVYSCQLNIENLRLGVNIWNVSEFHILCSVRMRKKLLL